MSKGWRSIKDLEDWEYIVFYASLLPLMLAIVVVVVRGLLHGLSVFFFCLPIVFIGGLFTYILLRKLFLDEYDGEL